MSIHTPTETDLLKAHLHAIQSSQSVQPFSLEAEAYPDDAPLVVHYNYARCLKCNAELERGLYDFCSRDCEDWYLDQAEDPEHDGEEEGED